VATKKPGKYYTGDYEDEDLGLEGAAPSPLFRNSVPGYQNPGAFGELAAPVAAAPPGIAQRLTDEMMARPADRPMAKPAMLANKSYHQLSDGSWSESEHGADPMAVRMKHDPYAAMRSLGAQAHRGNASADYTGMSLLPQVAQINTMMNAPDVRTQQEALNKYLQVGKMGNETAQAAIAGRHAAVAEAAQREAEARGTDERNKDTQRLKAYDFLIASGKTDAQAKAIIASRDLLDRRMDSTVNDLPGGRVAAEAERKKKLVESDPDSEYREVFTPGVLETIDAQLKAGGSTPAANAAVLDLKNKLGKDKFYNNFDLVKRYLQSRSRGKAIENLANPTWGRQFLRNIDSAVSGRSEVEDFSKEMWDYLNSQGQQQPRRWTNMSEPPPWARK
jgi:hypothetical protein